MFDMSKYETGTGLAIPDGISQAEHMRIGKELARRDEKLQGAFCIHQFEVGDWYNTIPIGDKKTACEEAGLNYSTTEKCGRISRELRGSLRQRIDSSEAAIALSNQQLTASARKKLLENRAKHDWTVARLRKEIKKFLGEEDAKQKPRSVVAADKKFDDLLDSLPKSISRKAKSGLKEMKDGLIHSYEESVNERVKQEVEDEKERIAMREKEAEEKEQSTLNLMSRIESYMTYDEYKLILSMLHPDRAPIGLEAKYDKAFKIFRRLGDMVNKNLPIEVLRKIGWEKISPRYKPKLRQVK